MKQRVMNSAANGKMLINLLLMNVVNRFVPYSIYRLKYTLINYQFRILQSNIVHFYSFLLLLK